MNIAVYCPDGMGYWGKLAAKLLKAPCFLNCSVDKRYDTVLITGMYDWPMYQTTLEHTQRAKKRIIMWCGTDVMFCPPDAASVLPEATHICDSENLKRELWEKGIEATVVPWPAAQHFPVTPLPAERNVAFYMGNDAEKYGYCTLKAALDVLDKDDDITLFTYQIGELGPDSMKALVSDCRVYVRLPEHDGGAMSSKEFLEAGRRVICTQDVEYAIHLRHDDLLGLVSALRKTLKETEPDYEAAAYWYAQNSDERWHEQMGEIVDA